MASRSRECSPNRNSARARHQSCASPRQAQRGPDSTPSSIDFVEAQKFDVEGNAPLSPSRSPRRPGHVGQIPPQAPRQRSAKGAQSKRWADRLRTPRLRLRGASLVQLLQSQPAGVALPQSATLLRSAPVHKAGARFGVRSHGLCGCPEHRRRGSSGTNPSEAAWPSAPE